MDIKYDESIGVEYWKTDGGKEPEYLFSRGILKE